MERAGRRGPALVTALNARGVARADTKSDGGSGLSRAETRRPERDAGSPWRGQMMMLSGFSIRVVKAESHRAAIAPSMTRWSADRVTVMTVAA